MYMYVYTNSQYMQYYGLQHSTKLISIVCVSKSPSLSKVLHEAVISNNKSIIRRRESIELHYVPRKHCWESNVTYV